MKGYKVFNPEWKCRNQYQFEVGKVFEENVEPKFRKRGFHFCTKLIDCFDHYDFNSANKVAEIEALGSIDSSGDDSKYCTNKISILKELAWHEVLELVNTGKNNTGNRNSGDRNSGDRNSGYGNSGDRNSGDRNSGDRNSGYGNSGYGNSGNWNSGNCNSGDRNSGDWNSGNCNSGDWNKTCFSNGCFNTEEPKIFIFNKLSDLTYRDWLESKAKYILNRIPSNALSWIPKNDMTDDEKEEHPEYTVTGGFLKYIEKETERQMWWNKLSTDEKDVIFNIPNFDKKIFKEITGIDVEEK